MRKLVLVTGMFLFLFLLNLNVSSKSDEALKIGMMTDITTLYPWGEISLETNAVLGTIYETLIRLSKTGTELEPCLAEKFEPSSDFKTWTFHLRKNVRFHDGSILNADAVVASLSFHRVFENKIKKIDDATVMFTLDKANVYFPVTLTAGYYAIASLATIKCYKANCKPVVIHGTGPFIFQQWNPNKEIVVSANQNYWGTKPLVEDVIFIPFQSDNESVQALKNQTIHLSLSLSPGSIEAIRELPHITFRSIPTLSIGFLSMNITKAPFRTIKVRQAIGYGINKNELIKKYFY